ncbi:MAG: FHA domain-containing protein, partial [Phycisphaerae bacterium]|nr:FHA domain-containing protein [Phycisphaerae bacterium]
MKVVLVKFRGDQRRDFALGPDKTVVGRATECTLRVPARDVSRRHCEIEVAGGRVLVRDLGSSNGTFLNGKRITEAQLNPGDRLTIGPVTFVVQIDGKPAAMRPADAAPPKASAAPLDLDSDLLDLDDVDFDDEKGALATDFGDEEPGPPAKPAPP